MSYPLLIFFIYKFCKFKWWCCDDVATPSIVVSFISNLFQMSSHFSSCFIQKTIITNKKTWNVVRSSFCKLSSPRIVCSAIPLQRYCTTTYIYTLILFSYMASCKYILEICACPLWKCNCQKYRQIWSVSVHTLVYVYIFTHMRFYMPIYTHMHNNGIFPWWLLKWFLGWQLWFSKIKKPILHV